MRNLILAIVLSLGFVSSAVADGKPNCGDKCEFYKNAPNTGIKPPVRNMVCFYFNQSKPAVVEFLLYSSYDPQTRQGQTIRKLKREFDTTGKFCVGSQFVSQAVAVEICNDFPGQPGNHSNRGVPSLQQGLATGSVEMCLLGKDCPRFER